MDRLELSTISDKSTPGLIGRILDDGGVIYGTCGKPVDNSPQSAFDDDDAGHAKYIRGALGRYIKTGLEHPPPDTDDPPPGATDPADDLALRKYRGSGMPCWGEGRAP